MLHSLKFPLILNALDLCCWKDLASLERERFSRWCPQLPYHKDPKLFSCTRILPTWRVLDPSSLVSESTREGFQMNCRRPWWLGGLGACLDRCQTLAVVTSPSCHLLHHGSTSYCLFSFLITGCCNFAVIFFPCACSVHQSNGRP